jgi:hypothetical protein
MAGYSRCRSSMVRRRNDVGFSVYGQVAVLVFSCAGHSELHQIRQMRPVLPAMHLLTARSLVMLYVPSPGVRRAVIRAADRTKIRLTLHGIEKSRPLRAVRLTHTAR